MDPQELQKNIALYYSKLPPKLQETFSAMKWLEAISGVSEKYKLKDEQKELLGTETTLVLLCIISLSEYEEKLTSELDLPAETVEQILQEISDSVLKSILPELIKTFEANSKETVEAPGAKSADPRFESLDPETKKAIEEMDYFSTLEAISRSNGLNVEQMGEMEEVVTGVVTGKVKAENMNSSLADRLSGVPADKITALSRDINDKILKGIRERLQATSAPELSAQEEEDVLGLAGIEILTNKPPVKPLVPPASKVIPAPNIQPPIISSPAPTPQTEKPSPVMPPKAPEAKEEVPKETLPVVQGLEIGGKVMPIFAQKLGGTVQTKATTTEHKLESSDKNTQVASKPKSYPKGQDPYRLPPV